MPISPPKLENRFETLSFRSKVLFCIGGAFLVVGSFSILNDVLETIGVITWRHDWPASVDPNYVDENGRRGIAVEERMSGAFTYWFPNEQGDMRGYVRRGTIYDPIDVE